MTLKSKIQLERLLFVKYQHPNINNAHKFLTDFGLIPSLTTSERTYYRGFGQDQYLYISETSPDDRRHFIGGGWLVKSREDLEAAAALPNAQGPIAHLDLPGGGDAVELLDPAGSHLTLIHGQAVREHSDSEVPTPVVFNTWEKKSRKGVFQRPDIGPSKIHKLGHYGIEVNGKDFETIRQWYYDHFNFAPTDSLYAPDSGKDIMTFMHLDKGEEFVDHHNFFIAAGEREGGAHAHHSSFEVDDLDSELVGHDWLTHRGWTNCWGVGRHLLGSQIFDYWFDTSGYVLEHYSDGDLVNCHNEHSRVVASPDSVSIWGPDIPLAFMTRKLEDFNKFLPRGQGPPPSTATA